MQLALRQLERDADRAAGELLLVLALLPPSGAPLEFLARARNGFLRGGCCLGHEEAAAVVARAARLGLLTTTAAGCDPLPLLPTPLPSPHHAPAHAHAHAHAHSTDSYREPA